MDKIILFSICIYVWRRFSINSDCLSQATNYNTNKYMKNKLLSLASLLAVFNVNAIEVGPTGSGVEMSGFVDIASEMRGDDTETTAGQVEVNFSFVSGSVSSNIGLDFGAGSKYASEGNLEEAYITYDFGNGFSVTGGKMLSYMGFEAFDPTNMYQYSYAYDVDAAIITGGGIQSIYDAHDFGASIDYGTDSFSIGVWSSLEANAGYELALAFTGIENFTAKAIWSDFSDQGYEKSTYWVSYSMDKLLLAAEIAENDQLTNGNDVDGILFMANYAVSDSVGLTVRYSEEEVTGATNSTVAYDGSKITISPSYVFNDNFSGLIEYSTYDMDSGTITEPKELIAAEFIYTF